MLRSSHAHTGTRFTLQAHALASQSSQRRAPRAALLSEVVQKQSQCSRSRHHRLPLEPHRLLLKMKSTQFQILLRLKIGERGFYSGIIVIIYSLTARVVGAPKMISQPDFSIFPCSPLPSGTCRTPGLSIP